MKIYHNPRGLNGHRTVVIEFEKQREFQNFLQQLNRPNDIDDSDTESEHWQLWNYLDDHEEEMS